MTGFGKASGEFEGKKLNVEIKTLNSKMNDTKLRIPATYREKELAVRNKISSALERGKIDALMSLESLSTDGENSINTVVAQGYMEQLNLLEKQFNQEGNKLDILMRLPGVIESKTYEANENEWAALEKLLIEALNEVDKFRTEEGLQLEADLVTRVNNIENHLNEILKLAPERVELKKEKLSAKFKEWEDDNNSLDSNRFEQELIYYLEKLDITEEKVRLNAHLNYFKETMQLKTPQGKKLGFIAQEMGREINTIGSKANHAEMQRHVVQMKDELEKIKEQILNVL